MTVFFVLINRLIHRFCWALSYLEARKRNLVDLELVQQELVLALHL